MQRTEKSLAFWVRNNPRAVDLGFAVLIAALVVVMVLWKDFETVPYHIAFVSLAVVYGFRVWSVRVTALVLVLVSAVTGLVLVERYLAGDIELEELSEIVLMPMILVAMAWHARRRDAMARQLQALADAERARWQREQEFLRDCSHALRTPLTVARGHVELIRDFRDPAEFDSDIAIVLGELDHLSRLASRLLAIADVERPDALRPQLVDLSPLVRERASRWSASVERHWVADIEQSAWVVVDRERIESALDALVENAVKVTAEAGTIRLICRVWGSAVVVAVADDGPGIDPEDADFVFVRFWKRPDPSGERGTGLGLAYVKSVAEAHGGTVLLRRAPEGGAVVGFSLALQPRPGGTSGSEPPMPLRAG